MQYIMNDKYRQFSGKMFIPARKRIFRMRKNRLALQNVMRMKKVK